MNLSLAQGAAAGLTALSGLAHIDVLFAAMPPIGARAHFRRALLRPNSRMRPVPSHVGHMLPLPVFPVLSAVYRTTHQVLEIKDKNILVASRTQYPLRLAWAMTIHKSQV